MQDTVKAQAKEGLPGPSQCWGSGEWGIPGQPHAEAEKCHEDDVMLYRQIMLYIISEEVRKSKEETRKIGFLLEHPAPPADLPEVVSFWRTVQWARLKQIYGLNEIEVNQQQYGGLGHKPTCLGTNLPFEPMKMEQEIGKRQKFLRKAGEGARERAEASKQLARWAPKMITRIAEALMNQIGIMIVPRVSSWRTHIQKDHYPFRKDCRICQEAAARGAAHYRQRLPPKAGVLSVDIAGPFKEAPDLERGSTACYMLVGTITWPTGMKGDDLEPDEVAEPAPEAPEMQEEVHSEAPLEGAKRGRPRKARSDDDSVEGSEEEVEQRGDELPEADRPEPVDEAEEQKEGARAEDHELIDMHLSLRAEGMRVQQLHSDRGGEFRGKRLRKWCRERDIVQTWTAGDEPQSNGRAEKAVQDTKKRVRTLLLAGGVGEEWWPIALRNVNEQWRRKRLGLKEQTPAFMDRVLVRRRYWKTRDLDPPQEQVRYLSPSWSHHGHWILRDDGTRALARVTMSQVQEPVNEGT